MKVIRINELKPKIIDLDYNLIKEEMERCEKKGKTKQIKSYFKLLENLKDTSSNDEIENCFLTLLLALTLLYWKNKTTFN